MPVDGTVLSNKAVFQFDATDVGKIRSITASDSLIEVDVSTLTSLMPDDHPNAVNEPSRVGGIPVNRHEYVAEIPSPEFTVEILGGVNPKPVGGTGTPAIPGYTGDDADKPIANGWVDKPQGVVGFDWAGDGTDVDNLELPTGEFPEWKLMGYETTGGVDSEITTSFTFRIVEAD